MKLAASTLSLVIFLSAPGLAPYQALAGGMRSGAPVAAPGPNVSGSGSVGARLGAGAPIALPQITLTGVVLPGAQALPNAANPSAVVPGTVRPGAILPSAVIPAAVPQAPAAIRPGAVQPGAPSAIEAGRELQQRIEGSRQAGREGEAIERFYTNARLEGADQTPSVSGGESAGSGASNLQPSAPQAPKADAPKAPIDPATNPELFAPRSSRAGIGPLKYVYWNAYYKVMQWFNLKLARDPNRRVSWDKWPTKLGLLYLIGKIRYVRSGTLTDPGDYAQNDVKPAGKEPETAKKGYTADGSWVSDRENPRMGAENTRFGSNIPPKKVRPDVENMKPSARDAAKLRWRKLDENGKPIVKPAGILNNLAGGWIQFNFHNFGGNTKRDPIDQNPHKLPRTPADKWPEPHATVDRTTKDPTRVTDNGRPTVMNERTQAWIHAQIYGTNEAEAAPLRAYKDGLMLLDENGNLPPDPKKPGVDLSGFTNNYNPLLSFLHWAFVKNHNFIATHLKKFNPTWSDEDLFVYARKINVAVINLIHTVEWTEDLLQHPTLQEGMHAEFYGLFGPKIKAALMRYSYRHPWFAKIIKPISNNDVIWGMPGSKWEHHDGPFQVPKHFRMVYRLHEMILDEQEIIQPGTDRTLDRIQLIDFVHSNTRPVVEKWGYDVLAYSFTKKSAGGLELHNFPRALNQFKNQQNGALTDLAELDLFRERTDGTGTYNEFRKSVGEPPVTSFLELTGGDAALAAEIAAKYESVDEVDAGIGILAEPKPAGFALGFTQFYQFVLNAPRRVKSNRHLTEYFTHKDYTFEGMEFVLHSGGMGGVIARAMQGLPQGQAVVDAMEGVTRWFAPWQDAETFPIRQLDQADATSGKILKTNFVTLGLGIATAVAGIVAGVASPMLAALYPIALAAPVVLYLKRMLAYRYMQKAWQSAYTDRRRELFPTLFLGEKTVRWTAFWGKFFAKGALAFGALLAWTLMPTDPLVAGLFVATALSALSTLKATKTWTNEMHVAQIALANRLRAGYAVTTDVSAVRGATALERRYSVLIPKDSAQPVARLMHSYRVLNEQGLSKLKAFKTALLSHLIFGPRTQRGLGIKGRWKAGTLFSPFAIYVPNMVQAQGPSTTRIYAGKGNAKGITPGDVDVEEFDRMFSTYAPGRDYMTAYDFSRMAEGNRWRASQEGVGGPVMRWLGGIAVNQRTKQLMELYADRVANEDKHLVPAISRDMLLRVYQGTAQVDLMKERALDGVHPDLSPAAPLDENGKKPTTRRQRLMAQGKADFKLFFGAVRAMLGSLMLPYTPARFMNNVRAVGTFFKTIRPLGWKAVAAVVTYYTIRDTFLYIILPYLLLRGLF